ncbi:MAG TPA: peptidyl-prolyl cis-trans isomerase [Acidobacteriaceae bacterium]|nr:peptidyl-prolyl cis-trans isomerase [Acidobacteriaceae bacterium]
MRRGFRKDWVLPVLLALSATLVRPALAQVAVPKYQSPLDVPQQPGTPTLPAPAAITPDAEVVEYPVARVNDQIIDSSDYLRALQQLKDDAQHANASPADVEQQEKDLLRDLIDQQLLLSRGKELEISGDSELIRRLDDIRKSNHFESMQDLEKAVRQQGLSYEDFKANIKNSIVTQEVVREEVGRKLSVTMKQEQTYYDAHKQDFTQPEQEQLSEILIPTPEDATDAQIAQAKAKADMVAAKLKAGSKFEDLAKQYSGGPTADLGGALGEPFKRGEGKLAQVIEDQVFALNAGDVTPPIRTRQGFILLKVTAHTQAGIQPLSAIEPQVQEAIYEEAIKPALRTYLTGLRENAAIEIQPGFVDTGASPKQVRAQFAASTPPAMKKKAAKKARLEQARNTSPKRPAPVNSANPGVPSATVVAGLKKPKKIRREKIRFGQAPPESLPPSPEETLAPGSNQGAGATPSALPATGDGLVAENQATVASADDDPLAPKVISHGKTRYSDRAPTEAKEKAAVKAAKAQQKAAATPDPLTPEEKATEQAQRSALGLGQDTATKKKKTKVKGAPKERIQDMPPAPAAPKPDATPIPPRSVRQNGEPAVTPPPDPSTLPPVTAPAAADTQPSAPANPATAPTQ